MPRILNPENAIPCIDLYMAGRLSDSDFDGFPEEYRYAVLYTLDAREYDVFRYILRQPWPHRYDIREIAELVQTHVGTGFYPVRTLRNKGWIRLTRSRYKNVRVLHENILDTGRRIMEELGIQSAA